MGWYSVRNVVRSHDADGTSSYEERITLWRAGSFDDAIRMAETEAAEYATEVLGDGEVLDIFQAYLVAEEETGVSTADSVTTVVQQAGLLMEGESGTEVFSLIRDSDLSPVEYIDRFFDTGAERQGHMS